MPKYQKLKTMVKRSIDQNDYDILTPETRELGQQRWCGSSPMCFLVLLFFLIFFFALFFFGGEGRGGSPFFLEFLLFLFLCFLVRFFICF